MSTATPSSRRTDLKIAYIGGGSCEWARKLMYDLALSPHITGHLALYDINLPAAQRNVDASKAIFSHPDAKTSFRTTAEKTPVAALKNADFVILSIEPGPTQLRYADLEIPAKYHIPQSVGDTCGPGGLVRALRTIPTYLDYAQLIAQHCPNAWVINYTNPMTICTASLFAGFPQIKAFGCCHEVFGTQDRLAKLIHQWFKVEHVGRHDIVLDITGVNHFTFATSAHWQGHDLFPRIQSMIQQKNFFADRSAVARQRVKEKKWFTSDGLVAYDLFRRFGVLGAAGDRHLAEFVPWYLTSETALHRWGVQLTPFSWRMETFRNRKTAFKSPEKLTPSGEEGVLMIEALCGLRTFRTNVNMPNQGQNPDLPLDTVTESYAMFSRNRIDPLIAKPLPPVLASHVCRIITNQQTTLQAGIEQNKELAFQALLNDPLVHLDTDTAWKMFSQMLAYTKKYLPGWKL